MKCKPNFSIGSCFAGIGGFDLAFQQAGAHTAWTIEIDDHCDELLERKFPRATRWRDIVWVKPSELTPVDVICGGFPCQDLSVAGQRAGLKGERSGLYYELTRIAHELQPAFILWENVLGLLSSDSGRDFARVLLEMDRIGYSGAWRTLDAQYFGLAQRRRRVFGLFARRDIGAECCAEVLSLAQGLRWNPAPSREAWKDVAGTFSARADGGGGLGTDFECNGGLQVSRPLTASPHGYRSDLETETMVAHTLRGESFDASEDGTGRGTPLVACFDERNVTSKANRSACLPDVAGTQHSTPHAIAYRTAGNCGPFEQGDKTACLNTATDQNQTVIAFNERTRADGRNLETSDLAYCLTNPGSGGGTHSRQLLDRSLVRRLTPRECERLQGFPDDWTAGFSDSTRYRMLGNSVAVPVVRWIAGRMAKLIFKD